MKILVPSPKEVGFFVLGVVQIEKKLYICRTNNKGSLTYW